MESAGGKCRLECSSTNLDTKTHRRAFARRRHAVLHGNAVSTQPLKNPTRRRSVWCIKYDIYKRIVLLVVARCHIHLWEDTCLSMTHKSNSGLMRFVISAKEGKPRDLHRDKEQVV
jgi:hypothetical protein